MSAQPIKFIFDSSKFSTSKARRVIKRKGYNPIKRGYRNSENTELIYLVANESDFEDTRIVNVGSGVKVLSGFPKSEQSDEQKNKV